ncbi:50S ribosomal protein L15 [Bombilactobacillus mellifer]|uniref:Large ribosomal subunit protein uL15 n=1 Tax=Bombilactobacillus mellifer TaxID=1218492 RepID=A0A0F4LX15_9LACO|nr:50S ribosomal protein L15 [Bombilactobacillus mellifer]MBH9991566.1 50S ribosomal protein L15 [Lactobacillus sp. W8092]KJY62859.1 50S ribosomal protein L15 [Bombilactobacillus mellifer]MCT6826632.1 50S ribosomal protein L15 [Bombilactobacillus mellifer]MCT6844389.1 50S ribosomal protein L15 [Bombilactobacillus mellifer]MCT6895122.1 50S ribosomal protein L15 [Bombilactobacillus mellifer]
MKLHELEVSAGSRKARKRVGRGTSSGYGKTAGRGQKGQLSRSGGKTRIGFEGGQMPLFRRMPKRGFNNINRKEYAIVSLSDLNQFEAGSTVDAQALLDSKIIKKQLAGVKLLANGKLDKNLTVKVSKVSEAAKQAVEAAGGSVEVI